MNHYIDIMTLVEYAEEDGLVYYFNRPENSWLACMITAEQLENSNHFVSMGELV